MFTNVFTNVFTNAQLDSLSLALMSGRPDAISAAAAPPSRDDLMEPLRQALAKKHPLCLEVSAKRPPLLTIVVTGRALDDEQVDSALREQVLPLCDGEDAAIPGDDVRLVLDLRGLLSCPRDVAVAIVMRWGAFAVCRCFAGGRVAVVMPQDAVCAAELYSAADEWCSAFERLRFRVLLRARDVAAFMEEA